MWTSAGRSPDEASEVAKLAEGVYARIVRPDGPAVSNAGFIVLENEVLVYDTHATPEAGQALLSAIATVTAKPVRYIVNSHFHPDHTHGNQVFGTLSSDPEQHERAPRHTAKRRPGDEPQP